jgi:hypothetical protein
MQLIISKNKIVRLFGTVCMGLFFLQNIAIGAQNSLELHSGIVKLIRNGKSMILQKAGETYSLLENDRLQTGKDTQVSVYLKNRDNTVKLFSHSFFKLDDLSEEENSVALLTGKSNFSVKPLPESSGDEKEVNQNKEIKKVPENTLKAKLGGKLKGNLTKLVRTKQRSKKKRFEVRTVTAIVGVRGTDFVVATSGDLTNMLCVSGECTMASQEAPGYDIFALGGEATKVRPGSGPSVPVTVSEEESKNIQNAEGTDSFQEVEFGPSEPIGSIQERLKSEDKTPRLEEEPDTEGELLDRLDRLEELETIVENAENAIDAAKSKNLILSMTFTNR